MEFLEKFYPTPESVCELMYGKIDFKRLPDRINVCEPSAGQGHLVDYFQSRRDRHYAKDKISCFEIHEDFQATLIGKGYRLLGGDWFSYHGQDKFDLILGNPPFNNGADHLWKAINTIFNGQIVFLLNSKTLTEPRDGQSRRLIEKLQELKADITYLKDSFADAERPTHVGVALVSIFIENKIEDVLFEGIKEEKEQEIKIDAGEFEVSTGNRVTELIAQYDRTCELSITTIMDYYKNYNHIGKFVKLNADPDNHDFTRRNSKDLTNIVQCEVNDCLERVRYHYWERVLELDEIKSRMTEKVRKNFYQMIQARSRMEFNYDNIDILVMNIIKHFTGSIKKEVEKIFDKFTIEHHYGEKTPYVKNTHLFDGWKTNKAWRCGNKVIIPFRESSFRGYRGWEVNYSIKDELRDIDIVMNYLDDMRPNYLSIEKALTAGFNRNQSKKIVSTYFTCTVFKKGTLHLEFNDEDLLRRFNIVACKEKNWLPDNYGMTEPKDLSYAELAVIKGFEVDLKAYVANIGKPALELGMSRFKLLT